MEPRATILTCDSTPRALVVDDSRAQRLILAKHLRDWGYAVTEAASGLEALRACNAASFDLILSDWMMPEMDGLEFCRAFRAQNHDSYCYFILLTSKNEKSAVAEGLDVGADDFLSKPVAVPELRARINAGARLLDMQRAVKRSNEELRNALSELQSLYDAVDRDLMEARKLQQSLIRERFHQFDTARLSLMLQSSGHVGGDMVGCFPICANRIGIFSIDVSGHGVAAAMLGARISGLFSGGGSQNIALHLNPLTGATTPYPPETVASRINDLMLEEMETESYLTIAYADLDLSDGQLRLVQAGHPHPVIQRADGVIEFIGEGGLPIGLIPKATYHSVSAKLRPGDRLLLYSDGITECVNDKGAEFDQTGLSEVMAKLRHVRGLEFLDALKWELTTWSGREDFKDDVSGALLEFDTYAATPTSPPRYYRGIRVGDAP